MNARIGLDRTAAPLESERACHDTDGQCADVLGDLGDDRRSTGTGATTLASGDEDHVCTLQDLFDLLAVFLGCGAAHLGIAACTQTTGQLTADVELDVGIAHQQCLRICVHSDELDALEAGIDHPVDGVDATATDADDLDHCQIVLRVASHWCYLHEDGVRSDRNAGPTIFELLDLLPDGAETACVETDPDLAQPST